MTRWLVLCGVVLAGCASLQKEAATAYTNGEYMHSVDLYDQALKDAPNDRELIAARAQARMAALRQLLFRGQAARANGDDVEAGGDLLELLRHRNAWGVTLDPRMAAPLAHEVASEQDYLDRKIALVAHRDGPLAAEALARANRGLLALGEFTQTHARANATLATVGQARCAELPADSPYLAWIHASYCTHFGTQEAWQPAPNLKNGVDVTGAVDGAGDFAPAVRDGFARSVWFSPRADGALPATLTGALATQFSSQPVTLTKHYTVQIPYTDYETQQESYQEPYDDTESYSEQVPSTTTNADGTTSTTYNTEWKTRTVTKYRTAYRDVQVAVTKYRDEDREYNYNAVEEDGAYQSSLSVAFGELGVTVKTGRDFTQQGYDHDESFAPAGLSPERANLLTAGGFEAEERDALRTLVTQQLDAKYQALYCAAATFTVEQAAACSYLDPARVPDAARTALREVFGGDEPYLATLLKR